jgi:hypothetical protein
VKIIKILNILSDKIESEDVFVMEMCEMINIYSYTFFKEKSSDELQYEPIITECMANLGKIFP